MFRDTDELAVTLTVAEWNQVLALLSEGLYRVVAPLIGKIHTQCRQQEPPPAFARASSARIDLDGAAPSTTTNGLGVTT